MNLMGRKKWAIGLVLSASLSALMVMNSSCQSPKEKAAIQDALKSLRKVASATEVGVTYMQYGALLIEAKSTLNEGLLIIKNGEVRYKLSDIMGCYTDAYAIWARKIQDDHLTLYADDSNDSSIIRKYRLPLKTEGYRGEWIDTDDALQRIWATASSELATLSRRQDN